MFYLALEAELTEDIRGSMLSRKKTGVKHIKGVFLCSMFFSVTNCVSLALQVLEILFDPLLSPSSNQPHLVAKSRDDLPHTPGDSYCETHQQ